MASVSSPQAVTTAPAIALMSTPISVFNPTTVTLAVLSILIIPAFLLRPGRWMQWLERKKYQYEVTIPLYMLTPTERFIFNSILFLLLSITIIAMCLYLPDHILHICRRMYYYVFGG